MRDSRRSPVLNVLLAVLAAGLAVSGFFLSGDIPDSGIVSPVWLSNVLAAVTLLAIAVSLNYVNSNSFLFTSDSKLLYLPYLSAVLAFPGALTLTFFHISAFLIIWAVYYALMYVNGETRSMYSLFMAVLCSSAAAVMVPPLLYACAFIFLYVLYRRGQDIVRMLLVFLTAVLLPWLYILVWKYFFDAGGFGDFIAGYAEMLVPSLPSFSSVPVYRAVYAGLLALIGLRAVFYVLSTSWERNKAQKNAFGLSAALSVLALFLELFFTRTLTPLSVVAAAVPFSFAVFDYLSNCRREEAVAAISLLLLSSAGVRVMDFVLS
ncbi:MAG TPA: hypothetical protein IAC04_08025 [Candidatus Coprenecus stercoravium]|uniref:Uncharacterized protein n=1 Tax=Candidatus Coprenecus stercoravium TaxID=2840735 RepID=A0A9D2GS67_9BACT|nr:hypothetical protein [Candidatus Coprenecus stercoravium]